MGLKSWLVGRFSAWLTQERPANGMPLCDFERLSSEIRPCDVLLVEGRSRVSSVIKQITQSPWTHAALYVGRLRDITDPHVRELLRTSHHGGEDDQLIIEALLGQGTIVTSLTKYRGEHVRICRSKGLSPQDRDKVIADVAQHLGRAYDFRHMVDLARFMYPYAIVPRRWRSTVFEHHPGQAVRTVCSSMIAEAFSHVHYPILPVVQRGEDGSLQLFKRNTRLYTPRDFDYSPYFDIIKYPILGLDDLEVYRRLPWNLEGVVCNDENDCYIPGVKPVPKSKSKPEGQRVIPLRKSGRGKRRAPAPRAAG